MCDTSRDFPTIHSMTDPTMLRRVVPALLMLPLAVGAACDGCTDPLAPLENPQIDPLTPDGDADNENRRLSLEGGSPVVAYRGSTVNLVFKVLGETTFAPKAGVDIGIESEGFAATVLGSDFVTGADGTVSVPVRAELFDGSLTVTATMEDVDGGIETAVATVQVVENPAATLKVSVSAMTRIPVTTATAHVYISAGAPTCEVLLAQRAAPPSSFTASFSAVPQTKTFNDQSTGQRASVLVFGHGANGSTVARGCAALDRLEGGVDNLLAVALTQQQTVVTGDYDVLMNVALGAALPAPYDTILDNVTGVLADPAGMALFFVMREAGLEFDETDTYGTAEATPSAFPFWNQFRTALDGVLADSLGQAYVDVTDVGAGLRDVVTDFEIGGRLALTEPSLNVYEIEESWRDAVVYWPLPCDTAADMACARKSISLADPALAPVTATYGATVTHAPVGSDTERYSVVTDEHGLQLNYGAFVLAILEQVVFPNLPASIRADSLGGVLINVVGCQDIADAVGDGNPATPPSVTENLVNFACTQGLNLAAAFAENQLTQLNVAASNPGLGQDGLSSSSVFTLKDENRDTELETVADFTSDLGWYRANDPTFSEDIRAPITGAGIRARAICEDDSVCGAGQVCTPAPSYLKIAAVTFGCRPVVGSLAGGAACTTDTQCGSGMCDPVGLGGALVCYEACNSPADCGFGLTCGSDAALIDLDTSLAGLGDVVVGGCEAP
jgi:hypothetical protein